ncbi:STAS domain-containing protein [Azospirillum sp.]|uniref:STAS domain-containing protein n=1 Tax=Azospirillum sp. TaxID=34012 RepID=UPI002D663DEC|nr:STAS domain-containing protein [Azospirillum sp.]HYD68925.1 STAS domain-containing protein [Azospirillum sp.]
MENAADPRAVLFSGALTIRNAESIHEKFLELLSRTGDLVVDASDAEEVDVSFVQLLLAARRSAREQGRALSLAAPAAGPLREVLVRGGFAASDPAFWGQALWGKGGDTP